MPKIRRSGLPKEVLAHLARRARERRISREQMEELARWLDIEPIAPEGRWFKRFASFTICGEGELVKTVLTADQAPTGTEMK
jgi:hypothetical protein